MTQTHITASAVVAVGLAEVPQQLSAPANAVVGRIFDHGFDALGELFLALLIDGCRYDDFLHVDPFLRVGDERRLALRYEMYDFVMAQRLQYLISLVTIQSGLHRYQSLVYIAIVGEQSAIVAQQGSDYGLFCLSKLVEPIQFVAREEEQHACRGVRVGLVDDISRVLQQFQCRIDHRRKILVDDAKLVYLKRERVSPPASHANGIVVGKVLVNILDQLFLRKIVYDALGQFTLVAVVPQQHGVCLVAVAPSAPGLLKISLYRVGAVDVHHHSHIGLVDAHAEGVGGNDDSHLVVLPQLLPLVFHGGFQSRVIERGRQSLGVKHRGDVLAPSPAPHIDDGRAGHGTQDVYQLGFLVGGLSHDVSEILAFKAHAEHIARLKLQLILNVVDNLRCRRGGQGEHRNIGHDLPDVGNPQV